MFCAIYKLVLILFPSTYTYLPEIGLAMRCLFNRNLLRRFYCQDWLLPFIINPLRMRGLELQFPRSRLRIREHNNLLR